MRQGHCDNNKLMMCFRSINNGNIIRTKTTITKRKFIGYIYLIRSLALVSRIKKTDFHL